MISLHRAHFVSLAAPALPALLACTLLAQQPGQEAPEAEPTRAKLPIRAPDPGLAAGESIDAILGGPLELGGRTITPEEVKRAIATGTPGRAVLESAKLQIFIEEEIQRQIDAGKDASVFQVTDADVQAALDEANEAILREFPNGEIKSVRDLLPMPETMWMDQARQSKLFDRVYLPENPNEYGETTIAALEASNPQLMDSLHAAWEKKQEGNPLPEGQPGGEALFNTIMRQLVMKALNDSADIKMPNDGLPPEVAMEVNGHRIMTDDVWKVIRHKVTETEVEQAKLWYVRTLALKQGLEAKGAYLDDEEFAQAYHEHTDPYKDSPFSIPAVAMGFKKFPSEDAYKSYYRIYASFKEMIKEELNDENLIAHVETRAGNLLGLARADVEIILCSAYDFRSGRFLEDGWDRAATRAAEAWNKLADGQPWDEVLDQYSEVYTPPLGVSSQQYADKVDNKKGRFGPMNRNELMQKLSESDYSTFLNGSSLTDTIFFDVEAGVPDGPFRGPYGYYIVLVKSRTAPGSAINVLPGDGGHRNLVEQDYLDCRINQFGNELLNTMEIKGF